MAPLTTRNLLIAPCLRAAIVSVSTGLAAGYLAHQSPTPQTRDFYLFAQDLSFSAPSNLNSDYIYSSSQLTVNKGDTVTIHFYNPTDTAHSFTIGAPYANDVGVAAQSTVIQNANITITTSQPGSFAFHCKFHSPQMTGTILVQG